MSGKITEKVYKVTEVNKFEKCSQKSKWVHRTKSYKDGNSKALECLPGETLVSYEPMYLMDFAWCKFYLDENWRIYSEKFFKDI